MGRTSDHFDGKRFFNPRLNMDKRLRDFLRWRLISNPAPWPRRLRNGHFPPPPREVAADEVAVTYIGQSTLLVQFDGFTVLTDPIFSLRAGPAPGIGPKRVRPPGVAFERLPRIDCVLLSHNHYDHMDLPSLRRLWRRWRPTIVTGLGNGRYLARKGIGGIVELDWWQSWQPRPGVRVTFVPAQHWSRRRLLDLRRALWGGLVVETEAGRVYFAGDTGYPAEFGELGKRLGRPDVALLPIGAYEPDWFMRPQHMNPDEAVRAHLELGVSLSIAMHFGTFKLTAEAIDAPAKALMAALRARGVAPEAFRVPGFGETVVWRRPSPD